jgi:putative spermidine/putrescine transport system permease protein
MPSIVVSLGIGPEFRIIDDAVKKYAPAGLADGYATAMGLLTSALGAPHVDAAVRPVNHDRHLQSL